MHNSIFSAVADIDAVIAHFFDVVVVLVAITRLRHLASVSKRAHVSLKLGLATRMSMTF